MECRLLNCIGDLFEGLDLEFFGVALAAHKNLLKSDTYISEVSMKLREIQLTHFNSPGKVALRN